MITENEFTSIQFGVCIIEDGEEIFYFIPVDISVQNVLSEMIDSFKAQIDEYKTKRKIYEPSEKYSSKEYLYMDINDENLSKLKELYNNKNLRINTLNISETLAEISFYFAIFNQKNNVKIIGLKDRPIHEGIVKK